jgi:hypothetical protein
MSPITMAILGLLAYKAVKSVTGSQPSARPMTPGGLPTGGTVNAGLPGSGGLGDLLNLPISRIVARRVRLLPPWS